MLERRGAEDAEAFRGVGGEADETSGGEAEARDDQGLSPRLIDLSALDVTGRRVHVQAPGEYRESRWRLKTVGPREPVNASARRAVIDGALAGPALCLAGGCPTIVRRLRGGADLLLSLERLR